MPSIAGASGVLTAAAATAATAPTPAEDPRRIAKAAEQFEALMIGQMLKAMHESDDGGWTGTDNDDAGAQTVELAEDQLAQALAQQGGLGLAHLVVSGFKRAEGTGDAPRIPGTDPQKLQP
jgi:Rod binding domain-containing protein